MRSVAALLSPHAPPETEEPVPPHLKEEHLMALIANLLASLTSLTGLMG